MYPSAIIYESKNVQLFLYLILVQTAASSSDCSLTCVAALLAGQVRQRRLWPAVAAQGVAVLGRDVRRQRRAWGQLAGDVAAASLFHLHGPLAICAAGGQEGVAEQLAQ